VHSYTRINLSDVEDQAPKFGHAPDLEARFASGALGLTRSGLSYQRLAPGARAPFGHRHKEQEEIYVVLGGGGRLKLEDEIVELERMDAVRIPAETARQLEAGPDGIEILAFGAPRTESGPQDAEMLPGWWSD
jgi:uncharacterized cupin superfamily protein